jgi:predicted DNA-binding antitoxin AbrB/MazE fold protein
MDKVFEAIVETDGRIKLTSPLELKRGCRVLVTIPSEKEDATLNGLLLSEQSLKADWLNPEEDAAWSHL